MVKNKFLLLLGFSFLTFIILFNLVEAASYNISACGTPINDSGAYYSFSQNIDWEDTGSCLSIVANNIVLDGKGFRLLSFIAVPDNTPLIGIYANGVNNITIFNLSMDSNTQDIVFNNVTNSRIENVTFMTIAQEAIQLTNNSNNNIILTNNISVETSGVGTGYASGVRIVASSNNTIRRNVIRTKFTTGSYASSIIIGSNSTLNVFDSNHLYTLGNNGSVVWFDGVQAANNSFLNNNFSVIATGYAINNSVSGNGPNYFIYNNSFGEIYWTNVSFLHNLTLRGNLSFGRDVIISNNSIFFNGSMYAGQIINSSANLTLYGSPGAGFAVPTIFKDGVACESTCYNLTALSAATVIFNITSWSSYGINNLDVNSPSINFTSPTPSSGSSLSTNSFTVNISTNDDSGHYTFIDLNRSLVGWYRSDDFNSSGGIIDLSQYSRNGSAIGTILKNNNTGAFGNSSDFRENGVYYAIPGSFPSSFTVSTWFYKTSGYTDCGPFIISDGNWAFSVKEPALYRAFDTGSATDFSAALSATYSPNNTWTHAAVTYNSITRQAEIYVNGQLNASNTVTPPSSTADPGTLQMGYYVAGGCTYDFIGYADDTLLFNRVLGSDEISSIYNGTANMYLHNFSDLSESNISYIGHTVDASGNKNSTETRTVNIPDVIPPIISFDNIESKIYYGVTNISFNITLNENGSVVRYSIDNGITNYSMITSNNLNYNSSFNVSHGTYNFTIYANDTFANYNVTRFTFIISNIAAPAIEFVLPTPVNNWELTTSSFRSNISTNTSLRYYSFNGLDSVYLERGEKTPVLSPVFGNDNVILNTNPSSEFGGIFGKALLFDGIQDCLHSDLDFLDRLTLSMWINATRYPINKTINPYSLDIITFSGGGLKLKSNSDYSLNTIEFSSEGKNITSSTNIINNTWYLLTIVANQNNLSLYVNGVLENTTTRLTESSIFDSFDIGGPCSAGSNTSYNRFNGTMDEIVFFSGALSGSQVTNLYNSTRSNFLEFVNISTGTHTLVGYAIDSFGNVNTTENRTIILPIFSGGTSSNPDSTITDSYLNLSNLCTDSDGGKNYFRAGTTKFYNSPDNLQSQGDDYCFSSSGVNYLGEYFCNTNGLIEGISYPCPEGCSDGMCVRSTIIDPPILVVNEDVFSESVKQDIRKSASHKAIEKLICGEFSMRKPINAVASNSYPGFSAMNSIDGNIESGWYGVSSVYPKIIQFDLGEKKCVKAVDLYFFEWDIPINADLEVSNDGESWKKVISNRTFELERNLGISLPETFVTRYVRITEYAGARKYGGLDEISFNVAKFNE